MSIKKKFFLPNFSFFEKKNEKFFLVKREILEKLEFKNPLFRTYLMVLILRLLIKTNREFFISHKLKSE